MAAEAQIIEMGRRDVVAPAVTTAGQVWRMVQTTNFNGVIKCLNTFWFAEDTGTASSSGLLTEWNTNVVPTWKANVTNAINFESVTVQPVFPVEGSVFSLALSGAGTVISLPAPCVCCGVITWRTLGIGRRKRGRTFIAGLEYAAPATSTGYTWQGTGLTRINNIGTAIYNRFRLGGNPSGYYLVVFSRANYTDNPADWPAAATLMTGFSVQPYIATMGTRRFGRGM